MQPSGNMLLVAKVAVPKVSARPPSHLYFFPNTRRGGEGGARPLSPAGGRNKLLFVDPHAHPHFVEEDRLMCDPVWQVDSLAASSVGRCGPFTNKPLNDTS